MQKYIFSKMQRPFFSIVLPTYNRAHIIDSTIQSVLTQTFIDWELIVVDDGSTDNTSDIIAKHNACGKIKYLWQTNQERSAARNAGIENSTGVFICFLDSDDTWRSCHLDILFQAIKENQQNPALYFTGMCWNFSDRKQDVIFESPKGKSQIEYTIEHQIGTPTVSIHHAILKELKFNTSLNINEDVELFTRIAAKNQLIRIPVVTVDVFIHPDNTKGQTKDYIAPQIKAMKLIFREGELRNEFSCSFKRKILKKLYHQHINYYFQIGDFAKMNKGIMIFLFLFPFDPGNKTKIVSLLYNLPGGKLVKCVVQKLKSKK